VAADHIHPRAGVIEVERQQIAERRDAAAIRRLPDNQQAPTVGLALSGGGIRSATFCLGVLQELEQRGVRPLIDYLSTVSGGGFIGSWWSALVSREVPPEAPPASTDEWRAKAILSKVLPGLVKRTAAAGPQPASRPSAGIPPEREDASESRLISHLRLHSNYLTPRSGIGSSDTWRAVTVIGRNLLLTWAVLLPFLLVAVLAAQAWFLATAPELLLTMESSRFTDAWPLWAGAAGPPLVGALTALSIVVLFGVCWQGPKPRMPHVGGAALVLLVVAMVTASAGPPDPALQGWVLAGIALGLLCSWWALSVETVWLPFYGAAPDRAAVRNRLLRTQQQFVQWTVCGTALLLIAGLGHVVFRDLGSVIGERVAEAGGFGAVALTLAGAVYTAFKASPTGGADAGAKGGVNRVQRLIFRLTPPLLMLLLLLAAAAVNQQLLMRASSDQRFFGALVIATLGGVLLCWTYASFEVSLAELLRKGFTYTIPAVGAVGLMIGVVLAYATPILDGELALWALLAFTLFCLGTLVLRFSGRRLTDDEERNLGDGAARLGWLPFIGVLAVTVAAGWLGIRAFEGLPVAGDPTRGVALLGAIFTYVVAAATLSIPRGQWKKAAYLLAFALIVSIVLLTLYMDGLASQPDLLKGFVLFGAATTWVLALGWSTDPNTLSLHSFYRARLVRAYLGASNPQRRAGRSFIDDAVPGDDVRLTELRNVETGAPYHLINATLNLVGNSDLGSSQRMAAPFVFARKYCGSRDEYVSTDHYVGGELSLGTAVAISGAAASPNMGSQTGGGGLAMLMTLFNVRLGFWAPRPAGGAWASRQPRFWAFYTLREFLSRTTDTASYCFLSDGGHFDNTGIYALVERGCRLIIAADCGADPARTFFDLGTLARRCRIDFGAEMSVAIDNLRKDAERDGLCRAPFTIGRITYSASYLASIRDPDPNDTAAYLVLIKPSLLGDEPVDVRQYSFENDGFPQQTTGDQWFDEAQFESYRRLGMHCARVTLDDLLPQSRPDGEPIPAETLLASLLQTAAESTETTATPPAAEEIGELLWAVALNAARVADVTFAAYTEAIIKSEFRRVAGGMFASGRTRPALVHTAGLQTRQLVERMATTARRRGAREIEERDWLDAVRTVRHVYPFSLGAQQGT
jgi:hypothetical protein